MHLNYARERKRESSGEIISYIATYLLLKSQWEKRNILRQTFINTSSAKFKSCQL